MPLPRLRRGVVGAGRHRRGGRAPAVVGARPGPRAADRDHRAARTDPGPADRQRRLGRADRRLRAHGQAAPARRVAPWPRSLRARPRGRPPLRQGHRGRRLLDVRRRDGSAGGGRRAWPRPRPHRGERGERQPGPRGAPGEPEGAHRDAAARGLPRLGRVELRPAVAHDVAAGQPRRHGAGGGADRRHPQRPGRGRGPVVVPHPAPHPVGDRGRGDRPHPPARIGGGGHTRRAPGQHRGAGGGVPTERGARRRGPAPAHRPTPSTAWSPAPGGPRWR